MFRILIFRNAQRSVRDYLIYIVTMTIIATLMFAFHGMIFSKDMQNLLTQIDAFAVLIGIASFFIIGIVIWLVHYIVTFMLEKRCKEFGTYLLLGMNKQQIVKIFRRENYLLGLFSTLLGIVPGYLFQLLFVNIFYTVLEAELKISPDFNWQYLALTFGILFLAYLIALRSIKRKMKKMTIHDFIYMDQKNDKVIHEKSSRKRILVFLAIAYILFFNYLVLTAQLTWITGLLVSFGLVAAIYLLYIGLSAFFIYFIQKQSSIIYKKEMIFILRQLSSKIKTMRFTMGTLTVLFTAALFSWMIVIMFADFQRTQISQELPFDVMLFRSKGSYSFEEELATIEKDVKIKESYQYTVYQNETTAINDYLYEHVDSVKRGQKKSAGWTSGTYFGYDTYLKLSDYNYLRKMLGYDPVKIEKNHYLLHGKKRLEQQWQAIDQQVQITAGTSLLTLQAIKLEPFSQNGLNGADYLIIVPDAETEKMQSYYRLLVADLAAAPPRDLQGKLEKQDKNYVDSNKTEYLYEREYGRGSDQILTTSGTVLVKDFLQKESNFAVVSLCFVMAYLGIVFLCAALTILAVQQLSDSTKHKKSYQILQQLGMSKKEIERTVLKQLAIYYFCPLMISVILSISIGIFTGERFVYYSGVQATPIKFYALALLLFAVIYFAYFVVTYIAFNRNLEKH